MKILRNGLLAGLALASQIWATTTVNVGDLLYIGQDNGTTQFFLDNITGAADCFAPDAPVCTSLQLTGILSYSYLDVTQQTVSGTASIGPVGPDSDNGGASYTVPGFILPSLNILAASFNGTFLPVDFQIDTGGGVLAPFHSTGTVVSSAFDGSGFELLQTSSAAVGTQTPEPASMAFMAAGMAMLGLVLSRKRLIRKFQG